jgi:DNA-binding response OmpR family regulator
MTEHCILIVEDDFSIRTLVQHVAQRAGFETAAVENGADAIVALDGSRHYCAVILDLMMPNVSGYDVIAHIRDNHLTVPVIVATAVVRNLDRSLLDPSIVKTVLTKPFDIEKLRAAMADACGR